MTGSPPVGAWEAGHGVKDAIAVEVFDLVEFAVAVEVGLDKGNWWGSQWSGH